MYLKSSGELRRNLSTMTANNTNSDQTIYSENLQIQTGFQTTSDTNRAVQSQKMVRVLKFQKGFTIYGEKTKALISCTFTVQLIYAFFFAYAQSRFSHDAAQLFSQIICI